MKPDIDSMPAGPEIDAMVAERVMGWKRRLFEPTGVNRLGELVEYPSPAIPKPPEIRLVGEAWVDPEDRAALGMLPPPYSTDDAAALEILKKIPLSLIAVEIFVQKEWERAPTPDEPVAPFAVWWVAVKTDAAANTGHLDSRGFSVGWVEVECDTPCPSIALAICRAALKATL